MGLLVAPEFMESPMAKDASLSKAVNVLSVSEDEPSMIGVSHRWGSNSTAMS